VKLCVNLQKSSSGTSEMLKTFYDECTMSKNNIFSCKNFSEKAEKM
jgi:hypothetical protein